MPAQHTPPVEDPLWQRVNAVVLDPMSDLSASQRIKRRLAATQLQYRIEQSYQPGGEPVTEDDVDAVLGAEGEL